VLVLTPRTSRRQSEDDATVELAISRGTPEAEIQDWCRATLEAIVVDEPCDVLFDAYIAGVRHIDDP
jgi:hypothetical protein